MNLIRGDLKCSMASYFSLPLRQKTFSDKSQEHVSQPSCAAQHRSTTSSRDKLNAQAPTDIPHVFRGDSCPRCLPHEHLLGTNYCKPAGCSHVSHGWVHQGSSCKDILRSTAIQTKYCTALSTRQNESGRSVQNNQPFGVSRMNG